MMLDEDTTAEREELAVAMRRAVRKAPYLLKIMRERGWMRTAEHYEEWVASLQASLDLYDRHDAGAEK